MADILRCISQWIHHACQRLINEDKLRLEIKAILNAWLVESGDHARNELNKLIDDECSTPLTYNHYYTDNVQNDRRDDQRAALKEAITHVAEYDYEGRFHISNIPEDHDKFISAIESQIIVDMDKQACNEAYIELRAYYKVFKTHSPAAKPILLICDRSP